MVVAVGLLVTASPFHIVIGGSAPASVYTPRGPIEITGNAGFTPDNGITGGTGTSADPYLIEGWDIVAWPLFGIRVANTDAHFVIRNVRVHSGGSSADGIRFEYVRNGVIQSVLVTGNRNGVYVEWSETVSIRELTADTNGVGIAVVGATEVVVRNNTLTNNGHDGVFVSLSIDIVIDGNRLSGGFYGLRVFSSSNLSISGNSVVQAGTGILVEDTTQGAILRNVAEGGTEGIKVEGGSDILVEGNIVTGASIGIATVWSDKVLIRNNEVNRTGQFAVTAAQGSKNVTIETNTVLENGGVGIRLYLADRILVNDNDVRASGGSGILVVQSSNVEIRSNVVGRSLKEGILLWTTTDVAVSENELTLNGEGLVIRESTRPKLRGNRISGDLPGIALEDSTDGIVASNTMSLTGIVVGGTSRAAFTSHSISWDNTVNGDPVHFAKECSNVQVDGGRWGQVILVGCENVSVSNVSINRTDVALVIAHVRNATVAGNTFSESRSGLSLLFSSQITLAGNNFSLNDVGLWLFGSSGLRIFHNNFLNNSFHVQAAEVSTVSWDAGYPEGGNYWSDYSGADNCSGPQQTSCGTPDGIGDSPYAIPMTYGPDQFDRYPLVNRHGTGGIPAHPNVDPIPPVALIVASALGFTAVAVTLMSWWHRRRA